jgi:hypothetical protein
MLNDHLLALLVALAKARASLRLRFDIKGDPLWAFAAISGPGRG